MSVKSRHLGVEICYIFNGREFVVNKSLPDGDYFKILLCCEENDSQNTGYKEGFPDRTPGVILKRQNRKKIRYFAGDGRRLKTAVEKI